MYRLSHAPMASAAGLFVALLAPASALSASSVAAPLRANDDANRPIRLPQDPALSPNGKTVAFEWEDDIWTAPLEGGEAERLTYHAARDSAPLYSPDGEYVYFTSSRSGRSQIHRMRADGSRPQQITFDSNRKTVHGITQNGRHLLISQSTDRGWHYSEAGRVFLLDTQGEEPKRMLFDVGVRDAALSPDGTKVLFVRGRSSATRKGYEGPQAAQLWLADLSTEPATLTRLDEDREHFQNVAAMDPIWAPDSKGFYFLSDPDGVFNLYRGEVGSQERTQVTSAGADGSDDGVFSAALSRDGDTLVMLRAFDLYHTSADGGELTQISLTAAGDGTNEATERKIIERATSVAFTSDGKQMAFVSGEDVYVMDRILKEPVRVTSTPHNESNLLFSADGSRLFFTSDTSGEIDIWEATPDREDGIWWMASEFSLRMVTDDRGVESNLALSPTGTHVAYTKDSEIFVMDEDGTDQRRVATMWSMPDFDWSPDGKWLTYATQDDNYNSDIFIVPVDGTREPFNLSRHPDSDRGPRWSGDGKRIAWVGRRDGEEADIYVVELAKATDEETERDEKLRKALEAMKPKGQKGKAKKSPKSQETGEGDKAGEAKDEPNKKEKPSKDGVEVTVDFDGIFDRVSRLRYSDSFESDLIWFDDGSKLAFSGTIGGSRGFHSVSFPRPEKPERIASSPLSADRWLKDAKEFVGHQGGKPASMSPKGKIETYEFRVRDERNWSEYRGIAFDQAWRAMRDRFYDEAYNNKDWYAIRAKYRPLAKQCLGATEFSQLMNMMLGELNASHMGHRGTADPLANVDPQNEWSPTTYHLGLRFDPMAQATDEANGLVVESVIPGSPCSKARSHVSAGETLLSIDDVKVGPGTDLEKLLTMAELREVELMVQGSGGGEPRSVTVRPVSSVAGLLYNEWVEKTRARVEELSEGKLGYLHIRGMNFTSFRQMEEDLYHAGAGKEGLVIDVRFNGGGSTTDHVLTALTQPVHAITRSRGSGEGYPQDRKVYASWSKPIVLMCNEHSFSNAEILSHAIKEIGRGKLVGMRTAGGVISTGSVRLIDGGTVRMPMRGWYLVGDGADMELNGCEPDIAMWNDPTWSSPAGEDRQLSKAVEVLAESVAEDKAKGRPKLTPASALRR
ncbi:MAG: S41 family peptidase [Planctomycetota bacterium]